ncbi:Hypothetical_protein [Hexamita inflata]|uniref:Hypothetical_protein n=1 Tax=Hexamita inflata TaxID=28002 RepID=A0AA86UQY3_9EUKA|nr:Hypothetical protein HINF_LOCUS55815 [Hexamita inflata]
MLSKFNKYTIAKSSSRISQTIQPKHLQISQTQQPKLKRCLSIIKTSSTSSIQNLEHMDSQLSSVQMVQMNQEQWNELISSDESEFDVQDTNMTSIFARFNQQNQSNEFLLLSTMIKQNMNGLEYKSQRLTDLLILASSQQASIENLQSAQIRHITALQTFD